jgi:putative membrane protein
VTKEITMMYNGMGGWGIVLMMLSSLLFLALVIGAVVVLVRYVGRDALRSGPETFGPTPQQTLAERFARGDVDEDEYTRRLQILDTTTPTRRSGG